MADLKLSSLSTIPLLSSSDLLYIVDNSESTSNKTTLGDLATFVGNNLVTTPGTAEASKPLVLDANKDFTGVRNAEFTGSVRATHSSGATFAIETISAGFTNMQRTTPSGQCVIAFDPVPLDGTSLSEFRFFRNVNTTGNVELTLLRGDGTTAVQHKFRSKGGPSYVCAIDGNFAVGINTPTAKFDVNGDTFRLRISRTPASASAAGNAGDICWDSDYIYICTATNTWRRIAHLTW